MRISPLKAPKSKPYALLYPGNRLLGVDSMEGRQQFTGRRSIEQALEALSGHVLYAHSSLEAFKNTTGALSWSMNTWKGRQTSMVHLPSGAKITSLRQTLVESEDAFSDLTTALDWLRGYGVPPGSISGMAWNLFRSSLHRDLVIASDPEITRPAFFGGRQQIATPRLYQGMMAADITAAYPVAMASREYALSLEEVSKTTELDPEVSGMALVTVSIPSALPYTPLPVRIDEETIHFPYGTFTGTYSWSELAAAKELGCSIEVHKSYAPAREMDLFGPWWMMAQQGRKLPGAARHLAKAVSNSTWGQFAMGKGTRTEVRWTSDKGDDWYELEGPERNLPHAQMVHIAAETTARVRRRMLLEGLYGPIKPPIHIDTDGVIISATSPMPKDTGNELGQWRVKTRLDEVDLRAPQLYRYTCSPGCRDEVCGWHYVASGMSPRIAENYFTRNNHIRTSVAYFGSPDRVLPRGYVGGLEDIERLSTEGRRLAS